MAASNKTDILKKNGTYNTSHSAVKAEEFQNSLFFDAEDLAQVKYEMLRSVSRGENSVREAAEKYGLSRQSYYIIKDGFEKEGLSALIHKKTGPKSPHKLTEKGQSFIDRYISDHPGPCWKRPGSLSITGPLTGIWQKNIRAAAGSGCPFRIRRQKGTL